MTTKWLMLTYKIPREPSANRVYVWRKLKKLGAVSLHDAVWVLPSSRRTAEHFRWLALEIEELDGEATLWESLPILVNQEQSLRKAFDEQVATQYQAIASELGRPDADLAALSRRFQQVATLDYFHSEMGMKLREALMAAKRGNQP
jgi:hypothetical protein